MVVSNALSNSFMSCVSLWYYLVHTLYSHRIYSYIGTNNMYFEYNIPTYQVRVDVNQWHPSVIFRVKMS